MSGIPGVKEVIIWESEICPKYIWVGSEPIIWVNVTTFSCFI